MQINRICMQNSYATLDPCKRYDSNYRTTKYNRSIKPDGRRAQSIFWQRKTGIRERNGSFDKV